MEGVCGGRAGCSRYVDGGHPWPVVGFDAVAVVHAVYRPIDHRSIAAI